MGYLFLLATRISPASPNFGQAKQGQKFVVPTFHIHFLNPECVTIPWVLAPKNFPIENFRVRSDLQKISIFHEFSCRFGKKNRRPAADSILMPPTFHIARLNRYTPNFSGEMPVKRELPAKIGRCLPKPFGHNFQNSALSLNQRYFIYIKIPLIQLQGSILKIVAERFWGTPF